MERTYDDVEAYPGECEPSRPVVSPENECAANDGSQTNHLDPRRFGYDPAAGCQVRYTISSQWPA